MQAGNKKHIKTIIIAAVIVAALAAAFFFTGSPPKNDKGTVKSSTFISSSESKDSKADTLLSESVKSNTDSSIEYPSEVSIKSESNRSTVSTEEESHSEKQTVQKTSPASAESNESVGVSEQTSVLQESVSVIETTESSVPESMQPQSIFETESSGQDIPSESSDESEPSTDAVECCTISISCETLLDNMDDLKKNKRSLVPDDGVIIPASSVEIHEGDSVFDLTKRLCMKLRIPFEFTLTPVYNTAYIEGIYNLYEFDCGSGSGWIYLVNGSRPSVGCSDYPVHSGDIIEWHYTCSLGNDITTEQEG